MSTAPSLIKFVKYVVWSFMQHQAAVYERITFSFTAHILVLLLRLLCLQDGSIAV